MLSITDLNTKNTNNIFIQTKMYLLTKIDPEKYLINK